MKLFIPEEVISNFVGGARLSRGERERLLEEKGERSSRIPHSGRTRISRTTVLDWVRKNERGGRQIEALFPKDRKDRGNNRVLDEESVLILRKARQGIPTAPVIRLIEEMKSRGWVEKGDRLNPSTVYRFLKRQGLMYPLEPTPRDRRRFEAEFTNDLWQSDSMHGPTVLEGGGRERPSSLPSRMTTAASFPMPSFISPNGWTTTWMLSARPS